MPDEPQPSSPAEGASSQLADRLRHRLDRVASASRRIGLLVEGAVVSDRSRGSETLLLLELRLALVEMSALLPELLDSLAVWMRAVAPDLRRHLNELDGLLGEIEGSVVPGDETLATTASDSALRVPSSTVLSGSTRLPPATVSEAAAPRRPTKLPVERVSVYRVVVQPGRPNSPWVWGLQARLMHEPGLLAVWPDEGMPTRVVLSVETSMDREALESLVGEAVRELSGSVPSTIDASNGEASYEVALRA